MTYELCLVQFREKLRSRQRLVGTFIKSPTSHGIEILASEGYDFVVIDAEHAALGRAEIDRLILAAKAVGIPALVRVQDSSATSMLTSLDCGAAGVVVPHVSSTDIALKSALATRFRAGGRGFSGTTRTAAFGARKMVDAIRESDQGTTLVVQVEDKEALDDLIGILSVEEVDAALIGRADLAISFGESSSESQCVMVAVKAICDAAAQVEKGAIVFAASVKEANLLFKVGATAVVLGSDQTLLRRAARETLAELNFSAVD